MVDVPAGYAKHEDESCWTHDHLLRNCARYRVDSDEGLVGYVEEVVFAADGSDPVGFSVRGDRGLLFLPVPEILEFSPRAERIVVRRPVAAGEAR